MNHDALIAKLRKLLALAERGEGGEAVNARELLERMMQKHGIDPSSLTDIRTIRYTVDYEDEKHLLIVIASFALQLSTPQVKGEIIQGADVLGMDLRMSCEDHGIVYSLYEHHRIGLEKSIQALAKKQSTQAAAIKEKIRHLQQQIATLKSIVGNLDKSQQSAREHALCAYVNVNKLVDHVGWENSKGASLDDLQAAMDSCVRVDPAPNELPFQRIGNGE